MARRETPLADRVHDPFTYESFISVMSKHSKHVPFWKKPITLTTVTLTIGLMVSGIALFPEGSSPTPDLATVKQTEQPQAPVTDTPLADVAPTDVAPVSVPQPRANAVELTDLALTPVELSQVNIVTTTDPTQVATAQKEYINKALEYESTRREAKRLANESVQKQTEAAELTTAWEAAVIESDRLAGVAEEKRLELVRWARTVYQQGMMSDDTNMLTMFGGPESTEEMLDTSHYMGIVSSSKGNAQAQAQTSKEASEEASTLAAQTKTDADTAAADSVTLATEAQESEVKSAELNTEANQQATTLTREINVAEINAGTFSPISAGQRVLNASAVEHWNSYLEQLKTSGVVLPSAEELREPGVYLPEGLVPSLGVDGNTLDGIALHKETGLTILPQETVTNISTALQTVGMPYGTENSVAQSCEVMVGSLYGNTGTDLATLWTSAQQQNDLLNMMPGDVVYSVDAASGITQASVYLGADLVVRASAASGYSEVAKVDENILGANRPSVPAVEGEVIPAPLPQEGSIPWKCGGIEGASSTSANAGWTLPVASGAYELGAKFEEESSGRWGAGVKTPGIEFLAENGTPVVAAGNGLATVIQNDPLWGNYVTITHADGLISHYSNLDKLTIEDGSSITAGTVIGTVGQTGSSANDKQSSTLVQIAFGEIRVDPQILFFSASASGTGSIVGMAPMPDGGSVEVNASGHKNGTLPDDVLCSMNAGGHRLRCDAARSYVVLAAAYKAHFGTDLQITDSYRTYESQVVTKANKGGLAATPGTSKHGWGLAVDLGGGIEAFGSVQHEWMRANAEKYGFYHPSWAETTGSKPEAWHWEYIATKEQY